MARLKAELEGDPAAAERARSAAQARAVKEREARLEEALARLPEIEAIKQRQGKAPEPKDKAVDPHRAKPNDSDAVAAWRERMCTVKAKALYKKRAATAECVNAQSRNRGLQQFKVRGLAKVKCVMLIFALAHNVIRMATLAPELLGIGTGASAATGLMA